MSDSLDKYVIRLQQSIKDAILKISQNLCRCVIVIRDENTVVGVISEGDIIRYLMTDVSLYTPIGKVVQPSFKYLYEHNMNTALLYLREGGITLIPIVDQKFSLKNVITVHEVMDYCIREIGNN